MDAQLTVRIPKDLRDALDRASRDSGLRNSEIVRLALQRHLKVSGGRHKRPAERVRGLLGGLESGVPDLGENHRAYVIESLTREQ
ncbi:MAG: CopG family transcriptional regulator [Gammaproteobacteria bacterium]